MKRTEETIVEFPFIETCKKVGYTHIDGRTLTPEFHIDERPSMKDVLLHKTLKDSLKRLNPIITNDQIKEIFSTLTQVRPNLFEANKEIYSLLTKGIKLTVDSKNGKKDKTFRILSEDPKENVYYVVNQMKIYGSKENIKPDIILFINGIPVVVPECKYSGTESNPLNAGLHQLQVYMQKVPTLFNFNQILISTFKEKAIAGSITGFNLYFNEWKDTYPHNIKTDNLQETMIYGLLHPENLTDIIFNHINFEGSSKTIPRYQQYRAVKKAMNALKQESKPRVDRGGIIFHTQRSGKTYTMINLAKTMHKELPDYKIVFLVDRVDLEKQHLNTFNSTLNKPIKEIDSASDLIEELKTDSSNIVFAMIHKFKDDEVFPLLNKSNKIIVVIDEAHRSQYKLLGANLNRALPNAPKLGFTGTPLFKDDKTMKEFGEILDSYTRSEAVADNCTVPLKYENRMPNVDADLEAIKEDESFVLSGISKEDKDKGIKSYVNTSNIYNSKPVIKVICKDIIKHFTQVVEPEGFKAMIVTESKKVAYQYFQMLKELNGPEATIIVSGDHNQEEYLNDFTDANKHDKEIANYKSEQGNIKILIVVDKLLTGFNAPICQTIYFCKKLKEHSLAQAIDRPVTPYPNKTYGLIIDYCGIRDDLEETIQLFDRYQDRESVYKDIKEESNTLKSVWETFEKKAFDIDLNNYEASFLKYSDEKKREELFHYFREANKCINILLPSAEAVLYSTKSKSYLKFIKELRGVYNQENLDLSEIGNKIKKILDDHVKAEKIENRPEAVDILSPEFLKVVKSHKTIEVQAAEAQYAIKKYIQTNRKNDPIFFDKMAEKVQKVLEKYNENIAEQLNQILKIRDEVENEKNRASHLGIQLEDMPVLHKIQKFLSENTNLDSDEIGVIRSRIVPKLNQVKDLILEKKSQQDGLYKETNLNEIKAFVSDLMDKFYDEKEEYEIYSNRAETLAAELIETYR